MVPGAGLEPARRDKLRGILSPLRLPISPPGHRVLSYGLYVLHIKILIIESLAYLNQFQFKLQYKIDFKTS